MANHYELLAIVDGRIADSELDGFRATLEEALKKHDSHIHYTHNLGRRKLAYPIKHQAHGTYLLCEFDAPAEAVARLERALSLTSELLRHCIVRRTTVGTPSPLERREEEPRTRSFRRTQDQELLGRAPLEGSETRAPDTFPAGRDAVSAAKPAEPVMTPPENEQNPLAEEDTKKKGQKASFEELDKKLNELLSDDII